MINLLNIGVGFITKNLKAIITTNADSSTLFTKLIGHRNGIILLCYQIFALIITNARISKPLRSRDQLIGGIMVYGAICTAALPTAAALGAVQHKTQVTIATEKYSTEQISPNWMYETVESLIESARSGRVDQFWEIQLQDLRKQFAQEAPLIREEIKRLEERISSEAADGKVISRRKHHRNELSQILKIAETIIDELENNEFSNAEKTFGELRQVISVVEHSVRQGRQLLSTRSFKSLPSKSMPISSDWKTKKYEPLEEFREDRSNQDESIDKGPFDPVLITQVESLDNDPAKIFQWVYNNTEWVPSWGETQSPGQILNSGRGSALDISALLVDMLRAAGFNARFVTGQLTTNVDEFMNWAGYFETVSAAQNYVSKNGLITTSLIREGAVVAVRHDHAWVEVELDYFPSRGKGDGVSDSWIPLDASFKSYTPGESIDISIEAGLTVSNTVDELLSGVSQTDGTIAVELSAISEFDSSVNEDIIGYREFATTTNTPLTPSTTLGARKLVELERPVLSFSQRASYEPGDAFNEIPEELAKKAIFGIGRTPLGEPSETVSVRWKDVNSQSVLLAFRPTTEEDAQILMDQLPDGEPLPANLPNSYSTNGVQMRAEIRFNDSVLLEGFSKPLGADETLFFGVQLVDRSPELFEYDLPVGSFLRLPVVSTSVTVEGLLDSAENLQEIESLIESGDVAGLDSLTIDGIFGELLNAGALSYYSEVSSVSRVLALTQNSNQNIIAGMGSYGFEPEVTYFFGFPRTVRPGGIGLNMVSINAIESSDGDPLAARNLLKAIGSFTSQFEHQVPEDLTSTSEGSDPSGMSTIKALNIALRSDQRVFTLTSDNFDGLIGNIQLDAETRFAIESAVAVGLEVTVHEEPISVPGWSGTGYIVADPATGESGFLISGGANGGFLELLSGIGLGASAAALVAMLFWILLTPGGILAALIFLVLWLALTYAWLFSLGFNLQVFGEDDDLTCLAAGFLIGAAIYGLLSGFSAGLQGIILALTGDAIDGDLDSIPPECFSFRAINLTSQWGRRKCSAKVAFNRIRSSSMSIDLVMA